MGTGEADSDGIEIREADSDDADELRRVASESLHASYDDVLDENVIDDAVEEWYGDDELTAELDAEGMLYLVAEAGGEVVGFSQSLVVPEDELGTVLWLHVDPQHRDQGVGTTLLKHTQAVLSDRGVDRVSAQVLAGNENGNRFYREHGFERSTERDLEIGDETYVENVYVQEGQEEFEPREYEGETLYVNWVENERGSKAPFFAAYTDEDGEDKWGYFCSNCESFDTAMDSMERLECNVCGNKKKPVRWDAAYL